MQGSKMIFGMLQRVYHHTVVVFGALSLTLAFFLVLPLIQTLSKPPDTVNLVSMDAIVEAPPPPPEPEPEEEEEEEQEEEPPELMEEAPPLDLSQLELALNPGFSDGFLGGDFAVKLNGTEASSKEVEALFSIADLDQKPSIIYQPGPRVTSEVRKRAPGTVYIIFVVDQQGRVTKPLIQKSTDPIFENPALEAVKKWKFEPGKRAGKAVRFRMRVPITFPEGV